MTHAELANTITDRLNGKSKPTTRHAHSVPHADMVAIASALYTLTALYTNSGRFDALASYDARAVLWDLMNEYNLDESEIENHPIAKSCK